MKTPPAWFPLVPLFLALFACAPATAPGPRDGSTPPSSAAPSSEAPTETRPERVSSSHPSKAGALLPARAESPWRVHMTWNRQTLRR